MSDNIPPATPATIYITVSVLGSVTPRNVGDTGMDTGVLLVGDNVLGDDIRSRDIQTLIYVISYMVLGVI